MASGKSTYLDNKVLDFMFSGNPGSALTAPTTTYIGLFTATPNAGGGGTEVTGGAYARFAVTANTTNYPAASGGSKSNNVVFTYPTATAAWGTITGIGIYDAASAGNLLYFADLSAQKAINSGDIAQFGVGAITIQES